MKVYSIKDTKGAFGAPFLAQNDQLAARNVKTYINGQKGIPESLYPEDFELWLIGEFDEVTGIIQPVELLCVCRLIALKDEANA